MLRNSVVYLALIGQLLLFKSLPESIWALLLVEVAPRVHRI